MGYRRHIKDIIKDVVDSIDTSIKIMSVSSAGTNHIIKVCDPKYLQIGFKVTISGVSYSIVDINYQNNNITLTGSIPPSVQIFNPYSPKYFHGTIIATDKELRQNVNMFDKTPMIYLYENIREKYFEISETRIERESTLRLYFLTQSNVEDWKVSDFYQYSLTPMRNLMELFLNSLKKSNVIMYQNINEFEAITHTFFGTFNGNGYISNYFNDRLAGIELNITLPILRETCFLKC